MKKNIAFAGSMRRIGTTTQCMQSIKYLKSIRKTACYIEMNANGYLGELQRLYADIQCENGFICMEDIDMFSADNLDLAYRKNYDYYIKDYGSANEEYFSYFSYAEQDQKIMVCGSKANEIFHLDKILYQGKLRDLKYLFSFVPANEREAIFYMMNKEKKHTYFAPFNVDMYRFIPAESILYKLLLNI